MNAFCATLKRVIIYRYTLLLARIRSLIACSSKLKGVKYCLLCFSSVALSSHTSSRYNAKKEKNIFEVALTLSASSCFL
ncbi:hypothetical protein [Candidatus Campylobacter infans]|uniref:hypothetical protein n=1 Tax=Candidatus Campylobacter infans TaxID=2561898 RepID=UPI0015D41C10|nr:hypothetical protein [Candidatus Campylobacter infans]